MHFNAQNAFPGLCERKKEDRKKTQTGISGVKFNTKMWKEFKRMVVEAAAETVDDEEEKEQVTKAWGKLISRVIGEMKNGFLVETGHGSKQSIEPPRGRSKTWHCANERIELLSDKERRQSKELTRGRAKT